MRRSEWILAGALAAEIALFAAIAPNFLSVANGFEVVRATVELGLLAIALTPVIVSGGIDVSVGSMMGLSAVIEEQGGVKSYWALVHPHDRPDFHAPACFAATLPAATGA